MESKIDVQIEEEEEEEEEVCYQPASPSSQYFNSSSLSVSILAILESGIPLNDLQAISLLQTLFIPINPRFSSIMVTGKDGVKQWKPVQIDVKDHVKTPVFPMGLSPEAYDIHFQDYLSKISMEQLPQNRPLWEFHIFKYPTSNAAGVVIFKLHHALGDGYSLMGALLSCFRRADGSSLPLTFPQLKSNQGKIKSVLERVPYFLSMFVNTTRDLVSSILKSTVVPDDRTPIKSGTEFVELQPINVSTATFSLDDIKQIKTKIGGTVNDIVVGTIFYGLRLYMNSVSKASDNARSTALVLVNTRVISGYRTIKEMTKPNAESPWGNQFAFLPIPIPQSNDSEIADPLTFVTNARNMIKRNKTSLSIPLTGRLLEMIRKVRGAETTAHYIYNTLKNTSLTISSIMGPVEEIALDKYLCTGMYYMVVNVPQSLTITMLSYMGKLRVAVGAEKDYIDNQLFVPCLEKAFKQISEAAFPT